MKRVLKPKSLIISLSVLGLLVVSVLGGGLGEAIGFGFLAGPLPVISFAAETVFYIGGFPITNSVLLFWGVSILLLVFGWLGARKIKPVPSGMQNFFETLIDFLGGIADSLSPKARRFLGLAFVLFVVILFSNWAGLLPVVGSIGRVETVHEWLEHRVEDRLVELERGAETAGFDHETLEQLALVESLEENSDQRFVAFDGESAFFIPFGRGQTALAPFDSIVDYDAESLAEMHAVLSAGGHLEGELYDKFHKIETTLEEGRVRAAFTNADGVEFDFTGKVAGLLVPYLRGPTTDLNITLTFAIFAVVAVQFFGVTALGVRRYGGKFINFRKGPILAMVGLLEIISELSRLVSYSFRLFGNLFAGEVLLFAMAFLLPLVGIVPFLGLEIFVGVIQAFIFATLVLIFSHVATQSHDEH